MKTEGKFLVTFTRTITGHIYTESISRPELDEEVSQAVSTGEYFSENEDLVIDDIHKQIL